MLCISDGHLVMDINARGCPGAVPEMGNFKQHYSRNKDYFLPNVTSSDLSMQGRGDLGSERLVGREDVSVRKKK